MLSKHSNPARVRVELNGTDVTSSFAVRADGRFVGLVTGLTAGPNTLTARESHGRKARITLTNHAIGGPVFSGPQLVPYFCRTQLFRSHRRSTRSATRRPSCPTATGRSPARSRRTTRRACRRPIGSPTRRPTRA